LPFYRDRIFGDGEFALCVGYGCLGSVQFRRDASAIVERQLHGAYPAGRQYSVAQRGTWVRLLDDVVDTDYSGAYRQSHTTPPPMTPPFRCHHVLVLRRPPVRRRCNHGRHFLRKKVGVQLPLFLPSPPIPATIPPLPSLRFRNRAPNRARGSGSAVSSPSGVRVGAAAAHAFLPNFNSKDGFL